MPISGYYRSRLSKHLKLLGGRIKQSVKRHSEKMEQGAKEERKTKFLLYPAKTREEFLERNKIMKNP